MSQPGTPGAGYGASYWKAATTMNEGAGDPSSGGSSGGGIMGNGDDGRSGGKRKKLAGYLKAANELRQTYQQSYRGGWSNQNADYGEDDQDLPGAFPDAAVVRNGDEEMVLFPSYARRHIKRVPRARPAQNLDSEGERRKGNDSDEERQFWKEEFERVEDDKAIVDVDVRGWIYSPHRGPMTRKNRIMMGLARHLSGIPGPPTNEPLQGVSGHQQRHEVRAARHEEEVAIREAESILKRGDREAHVAEEGGYSEDPNAGDRDSIYSLDNRYESGISSRERSAQSSREQSPNPGTGGSSQMARANALQTPAQMSGKEIQDANKRLMKRLLPFMTTPLANTPITVFFYNSETSQSRTIMTDDAGHFTIRAALDFLPTEIRVLASEGLSATESVNISEPSGVSLISDIDDTIKHSAIGSGAKEIFRNTFVKELGGLTIEGVADWYNELAKKGVQIHYVSNSPWQLFPLLKSYFDLAGLPAGSFHLKQYSGMLQGIFEPVAERKKSTLERILRDFPERRFLLIGDSGEADLEVYTDVVVSHPGRIIAVFIRDITTPKSQGFFDMSTNPGSGTPLDGDCDGGRKGVNNSDASARYDSYDSKANDVPSGLPTRSSSQPSLVQDVANTGPPGGNLIDFGDESDPETEKEKSFAVSQLERTRAESELAFLDQGSKSPKKAPPKVPSKPLAYRSSPSQNNLSHDAVPETTETAKKIPPPPPKPRGGVAAASTSGASSPAMPVPGRRPTLPPPVGSAGSEQGWPSYLKSKATTAYTNPNALFSSSPETVDRPNLPPRRDRGSVDVGLDGSATKIGDDSTPPLPPRRGLTSYPVAAAQYASNRVSAYYNGDSGSEAGNAQPVNKREQLWKARCIKAKQILHEHGVDLYLWRVGNDVRKDAVRLVEQATKEGVEKAKKGQDPGR
jgi:phosphatidate phosphatase APP1